MPEDLNIKKPSTAEPNFDEFNRIEEEIRQRGGIDLAKELGDSTLGQAVAEAAEGMSAIEEGKDPDEYILNTAKEEDDGGSANSQTRERRRPVDTYGDHERSNVVLNLKNRIDTLDIPQDIKDLYRHEADLIKTTEDTGKLSAKLLSIESSGAAQVQSDAATRLSRDMTVKEGAPATDAAELRNRIEKMISAVEAKSQPDVKPVAPTAAPVQKPQAANVARSNESSPGLNKLGHKVVDELFGSKSQGGEVDDIERLKREIAKTKLQNELAALKPKPHVESAPKEPYPKVESWEFKDDPKFSERGERMRASLRARMEGRRDGLSDERQLNKAKYFYEIADWWKNKFPLWGKIAISASILTVGSLAAMSTSPVLAGFAALSALTWRTVSSVGAGAVMGTATYTYLKKRNSRHPVLYAALAAIGMGAAVGVGGKYLAEYLDFNTPNPAPDLAWHGSDTLMVGTGSIPVENGVEVGLQSHLVGPHGLLTPYNFSDAAKKELMNAMKLTLVDPGGFGAELLGRNAEVVGDAIPTRAGDVLHMNVLGREDFTNMMESYISKDGTPNLWKELADKGGPEGLALRLREAFAK